MSRRKLVMGSGLLASYSSASHVNISFQHLDDASGKVGTDHSDTLMTWKYLFIFYNGMVGVFLMLIELQVAWDGKQLERGSRSSRTLRFLITFLTILLIVQLIDYYNGLLAVMTNSWKSARINTGFNISVWSIIRSSQVAPMFWFEVILCLLHSPPIQAIDDKWGMLMLLRFYMVFRIIRDRSIIYKRRNTIMRKYLKYGIKHWGPPKFDWFLAVKSLFVRRPFPFMFLLTLWTLWACGHTIYIFEREIEPARFTYLACQYLSMISMITGWPTDTYEYYLPNTRMGKFACIMSTLLGLFLLTMLLEILSSWFVATPHQRPAIIWSHRQDIKHQLRDAAARIIQLVWRKHICSTIRAGSSFVERRSRCSILPRESLGTRYVNAVRDFRRLMRQKVSLQVNFIESQQNNNNTTTDFDDMPLSHQPITDEDSYSQGLLILILIFLFVLFYY
eukprot:Phypoly_transcript_05680.p1 GENE.Phypoly_transcript_05680~~Phypoly_transcript_05680.p1  ORF type:complete len:448 (+),score=20.33 Phypoly_transcript_05680:100-1443(+)